MGQPWQVKHTPCNAHEYLALKELFPLGPYSRPTPMPLRWSLAWEQFLMSEVPLYIMHPKFDTLDLTPNEGRVRGDCG